MSAHPRTLPDLPDLPDLAEAPGNPLRGATPDTEPAANSAAALAEFRCDNPMQVLSLLCELRDTAGPVVLSSPDGQVLRATLWTVDAPLKRLSFEVEPTDPALAAVVGSNECTAVAYLQKVKLQFDLEHLLAVRSPHATALQAHMPAAIYRFQRRQAYRVATLDKPVATAELRHPDMPDMLLSLRVMDVSASGCALQMPPDLPPLPLGLELEGVHLLLDPGTRLRVRLRMQHASSLSQHADGLRLGCELIAPGPDTVRALQRYVDQLQRRRRLLALE